MRRFILGADVAYPNTATNYKAVAPGAIGAFNITDGKPAIITVGLPTTYTVTGDLTSKLNLVLGRTSAKGGPKAFPLYKKDFTYKKMVYKPGVPFVATTPTINTPVSTGTYTIILVKRGALFNVRNKYSASIYVPADDQDTYNGAWLTEQLTKEINNNCEFLGLTAVATLNTATPLKNSTGFITITASEAGPDYEVIFTDDFEYAKLGEPGVGGSITHGEYAEADAKMVADLAAKAAAEEGYEYTFDLGDDTIYPNYPLDPLTATPATDYGFTIFTIRFAEPREYKNTDSVVYQIIQVAYPNKSTQTADVQDPATAVPYFESLLKAIAAKA
jgi:hypothetical protein